MISVTRYHPLLVVLHWVLAALIIGALTLGALVMARIPNSGPMKFEALRSHMIGGALILFLMLVRLGVRARTDHPPDAPTGSAALDRVAWWSHRLLYAAVLAMALSGVLMALETRLPWIIFAHQGHLPPTFWAFPIRTVHYALSRILIALIALHIAGAAYHTFVRRDHLLRRMFFGRRHELDFDDAARRPATSGAMSGAANRPSKWLSRLVLFLAAALLIMIGLKFILDPAGAAAESGILLTSPVAHTNERASFGAFPLAAGLIAFVCLLSVRLHRTGLAVTTVTIGVVLLVRVFGVVADGTLHESKTVLAAETVLLTLCSAALIVRNIAGSPASGRLQTETIRRKGRNQ